MVVLDVARYVAPRDLDPDEDVAHGDEDHGQEVAEEEVADEEKEGAVLGPGPRLDAEVELGVVAVGRDQVEEEQPRRRRRQRYEPDDDDHHASPSLRYLALEGPPNGQESAIIHHSSYYLYQACACC